MRISASQIVSGTADDAAPDYTPLVVDLDGTLIASDLLVESAFAHLGRFPARTLSLVSALRHGKAALKAQIAAHIDVDVAHLPYDARVLALIEAARAAGRPVYLASASNARYVAAVADHLGLFDGWFGSSSTENLSSATKAQRLTDEFGAGGFDYAGNDSADLAVWAQARRRIAVDPPAAVRRQLLALDPQAMILERAAGRLKDWPRLLRVHQWVKNVLVFVPLVTAHHFDPAAFLAAFGAFLAFSLAASGVYILNDLVDLDADRKHRSKRHRPLASGAIAVRDAMIAAPLLVAASGAVALLLPPWFGAVLTVYLVLTTAYTFWLKRKMMIDVVTLALLYTLRVIGGAAAIAVPLSEWLLAFSMFIFVALALIKRYTELAARLDANLPDPTNRNYRKSDLEVISAMSAASGFNMVTVFTLYISSESVRPLYSHPLALWLICPLLMYWFGRMLVLAHRRMMDDDPIVFAMRDKISIATFALIFLIILVAK